MKLEYGKSGKLEIASAESPTLEVSARCWNKKCIEVVFIKDGFSDDELMFEFTLEDIELMGNLFTEIAAQVRKPSPKPGV